MNLLDHLREKVAHYQQVLRDEKVAESPPVNQCDDGIPSESDIEVLQAGKRLSESLLWQLQEDYYERAGISAWEQIPFYPTSNPFIGESYAELIVAFLLDYRSHIKWDEPLYIVEMATGTGCFSFYLLRSLLQKLAYFDDLKRLKIRYVMTDFTEKNVRYWETNNKLAALRDGGVLDFAVFNPVETERLYMRSAGKWLAAGATSNPVIAIANYFFDSISHDLFRVSNHSLQEVKLTFYREKAEASQPVSLQQLKSWETFYDTGEHYYPDQKLNKILSGYREHFDEASIILPVGALQCIRHLQTLSADKLALLSSDKGFTTMDYMAGHWRQVYTPHDGAFSYMVNYDAIGRYFTDQGGATFFTTEKTHSVVTTMNVLLSQTDCALEQTGYYFQEKINKQNLINNLYDSEEFLRLESDDGTQKLLNSCLSFLRLSNYDPIVLYMCGDKICCALEDIDEAQRESLLAALTHVQENIYAVQRFYNTYYWLGKIYYDLDMLDECLQAFSRSIESFGPDGHSAYHVAACHEAKGDYQQALDYYRQTQALDPKCALTRQGIERMKVALAKRSVPANR